MTALVGGDLRAERLGIPLDLFGIYLNPGQFIEQLAAFLKADHGSHRPHHANDAGSQIRIPKIQCSIARTKSVAAISAVIVRPIQPKFAQHTLKSLASPSGIARRATARAKQMRAGEVGQVGVDSPLNGTCRYLERLAACGCFQSF